MPENGHLVGKPSSNERSDTSTIYIPVTFNIVGTDEGEGYYPYKDMLKSLCALKTKLVQVNIHPYIAGLPNFINHSAFYNMSSEYFF